MAAKEEELPSTPQRSPQKGQRTYEKTHVSAEGTYDGDEERAHRAAWASVKHIAEKKGDHWELKDDYGPSDERSELSGRAAREGRGETHGGIDAGKSKQDLYADARDAGIGGRSNMSKDELVEALEQHSERATRRARS